VVWRVVLIALAGAAAVVQMPAGLVERYYSTGVYRLLQPVLTGASNAAPFALFDALCVGAIGAWLWLFLRDTVTLGRRKWLRVAGRLVIRTLVLAAGVYVAFLAVWGLNYRRLPLTEKVQFDPAAISPDSARLLAQRALNEMNGLYESARRTAPAEAGDLDPSLSEAFAKVQEELGARNRALVARPKHSLLDPYFRMAAVEGMTAPFFVETLVASDLLPVELPFVVAHEWSHVSGFADEGEANFVGWLTCLRGSEHVRYSGWLFMYVVAAAALPASDRSALAERLAPGPREDLRAIAERRRRNVRPALSQASWRAYDRYLKANRVESGAASYQEVLRLVLGTRFGHDWTPFLRQPHP
jgi:hypothetical protein